TKREGPPAAGSPPTPSAPRGWVLGATSACAPRTACRSALTREREAVYDGERHPSTARAGVRTGRGYASRCRLPCRRRAGPRSRGLSSRTSSASFPARVRATGPERRSHRGCCDATEVGECAQVDLRCSLGLEVSHLGSIRH